MRRENAAQGRQEPILGVAIRSMTAADVEAVAAIERDLYPNPWRREHFAGLVDAPGALAWVGASSGDEIVGYVVARLAADEAEIANLAVARPWQGRGVGSRLLAAALAAARERGARHAWLEVRVSNAIARSLYVRHGFEVVGRRRGYYANPREDALVMVAELAGG